MVASSRLRMRRMRRMCSMTSLCVSRTSAERGVHVSFRSLAGTSGRAYLWFGWCPSRTSAHMGMQNRVGLRPLLLGAPLSDREVDHTLKGLESHVGGMCGLVEQVYGTTPAARQAAAELNSIAQLPTGEHEVTCKRATVLFGLSKEPELLRYFSGQERAVHSGDEPSFTEDMVHRVLPFVAPRFLRHSCQSPDSFVLACVVLGEMWRGEKLGNWPRKE
jgi:hypothetical protein